MLDMGLAFESGDVSVDLTATGNRALDGADSRSPEGSITALSAINAAAITLFKSLMGLFVPLAAASISTLGCPLKDALRPQSCRYVPPSEEIRLGLSGAVEDVVMMGRYGHMNFLRMTARRTCCGGGVLNAVGLSWDRVPQAPDRRIVPRPESACSLPRASPGGTRSSLLDEPFTGVDVTTENTDHPDDSKDLRAEGG